MSALSKYEDKIDNPVAPGCLGPIHRRIGFPEDVVGGQSMIDEEVDADAGRAMVLDRRLRLAFPPQGQRIGGRQAETNLVGQAPGPEPRFGFVASPDNPLLLSLSAKVMVAPSRGS